MLASQRQKTPLNLLNIKSQDGLIVLVSLTQQTAKGVTNKKELGQKPDLTPLYNAQYCVR